MSWETMEGIVVQVAPFQEVDALYTVYTPSLGLVKLVHNFALTSSGRKKGVLSPLNQAEFVYRKTSSELLTCKEFTILEPHTKLRENLIWMEAGGHLLQVVRQTQPFGKSSPKLYQLLLAYLDNIPKVDDPKILIASFKLKVLRYEGLIAFDNRCCLCDKLLDEMDYDLGQFYCAEHAPQEGLHFNVEESQIVFVLALTRSLSDLKLLLLDATLEAKIDILFKQLATA